MHHYLTSIHSSVFACSPSFCWDGGKGEHTYSVASFAEVFPRWFLKINNINMGDGMPHTARCRARWALSLVALSLLNGAVYIGVLLSRSRHARRVEVYAKSAAAPALRGVAAAAAPLPLPLPPSPLSHARAGGISALRDGVASSSHVEAAAALLAGCARFETIENADYAGFDLAEHGIAAPASNIAACCRRCAAREQCAGFTYHAAGAACFLKSAATRRVPKGGYTAGRLLPSGAAAQPPRVPDADAAVPAAHAAPLPAAAAWPATAAAPVAVGHHAAAKRVVVFTAADRGYISSKGRSASAKLRSGQQFRVLESYALSRMCYCLRHGYTLHADVGDIADEANPMHVAVLPNKWFKTSSDPEALKSAEIVAKYSRRILVAQKLMLDRSARFLMFADMDVFIADQSVSVDAIVALAQAAYARQPLSSSSSSTAAGRQCDFIAQDSDHVVNSGWWIVRNTEWSRDFIALWRTQVETGYTWMYDQGGLQNALLYVAAKRAGRAAYANECLKPNPDAHAMNLCYRKTLASYGFPHGQRFFDRICLIPASQKRLNIRGEYTAGDFLLHASIINAQSSFNSLPDTCDLHGVPAAAA